MNGIKVRVRLCSSVLFGGVSGGDQYSTRSLPYIPGGVIRGVLIAESGWKGKDLMLNKSARSLFFDHQVFFLNGYPAYSNGERMLPVPLSLFIEKNADLEQRTDAVDLGLTDIHNMSIPAEAASRYQYFHNIVETSAALHSPIYHQQTHIAGKERGKVSEPNVVFSYDSLYKGQDFVFLILSKNSEVDTIKDWLPQGKTLLMGRSRGGNYGRIEILEVKSFTEETSVGDLNGKNITTITFLSDAILRDKYGQPTTNLDDYLSAKLGKTINHHKIFSNQILVGGFNGTWRLPLDQQPAICMGSVYTYPSNNLSPEDLNSYLEWGIGERREEGFGRIAINLIHEEKVNLNLAKIGIQPEKPEKLSEKSRELAHSMAQRILEIKLKEAVRNRVERMSIMHPPQNHQLGRIQSAVQEGLLNQKSIKDILDFFNEEKLRPAALQQFMNARIQQGNHRLYHWIRDTLMHEGNLDVIEQIGYKGNHPEVGGETAIITEKIKDKYSLLLVNGLLKKTMRAKGKEGES